jgi:Bacterial regulatory proteins, tetR family
MVFAVPVIGGLLLLGYCVSRVKANRDAKKSIITLSIRSRMLGQIYLASAPYTSVKHMKQDSAMKLCDDGADTTSGARAKRLTGPNRRAQVLRTASAQFARTGLHGTTTLTFAQAAGISEAILYVHFGDKIRLFREAVEINTEMRLGSLDSHLSSIAAENQIDWIESMAEAP